MAIALTYVHQFVGSDIACRLWRVASVIKISGMKHYQLAPGAVNSHLISRDWQCESNESLYEPQRRPRALPASRQVSFPLARQLQRPSATRTDLHSTSYELSEKRLIERFPAVFRKFTQRCEAAHRCVTRRRLIRLTLMSSAPEALCDRASLTRFRSSYYSPRSCSLI